MVRDPVTTAIKLNDINNYPDVLGKQRSQLIAEANSDARPTLVDNMKNHLALIQDGRQSNFDPNVIKPILGPQAYADFKDKETGIIIFKQKSADIFNAKIGTESSVIESYPIRKGSEAFDLEMKQKLVNFASKKDELLKKDQLLLLCNLIKMLKTNILISKTNKTQQLKNLNLKNI